MSDERTYATAHLNINHIVMYLEDTELLDRPDLIASYIQSLRRGN